MEVACAHLLCLPSDAYIIAEMGITLGITVQVKDPTALQSWVLE